MWRLLQHAATEAAHVQPLDLPVALILERHGLVLLDEQGVISLTPEGQAVVSGT
jgi:hypothetical protein